MEIVPQDGINLPIPSDMIEKLTQAEIRLLTVLADPNARQLEVTEIARLAGIHRDTYYRAFKKPYFVEVSNQLALAIVKQHAVPLVHAGVQYAKDGSFQHWKILMEMAGLHDSKRAVIDVDDENGLTIRFQAPQKRLDVTPSVAPGPDPDDE